MAIDPATVRPEGASPRSRIRTYKPRRGRRTPRQSAALAIDDGLLLPAGPDAIDLESTFAGRPVICEIGFGTGAATVAMAEQRPDLGILAIDVHTPGIGDLLWRIREERLDNIRVVEADALDVLGARIADGALAGIRTYFPDPWPKARHHKRRLVQPDHVALLAAKTRPDGSWHLATDWLPYVDHARAVLDASGAWTGGVIERPTWRPTTRYELIARQNGRTVTDLWYERAVDT